MKLRIAALTALVLLLAGAGSSARADTLCFELRVAGGRTICAPLP